MESRHHVGRDSMQCYIDIMKQKDAAREEEGSEDKKGRGC